MLLQGAAPGVGYLWSLGGCFGRRVDRGGSVKSGWFDAVEARLEFVECQDGGDPGQGLLFGDAPGGSLGWLVL